MNLVLERRLRAELAATNRDCTVLRMQVEDLKLAVASRDLEIERLASELLRAQLAASTKQGS